MPHWTSRARSPQEFRNSAARHDDRIAALEADMERKTAALTERSTDAELEEAGRSIDRLNEALAIGRRIRGLDREV